MHLSIVTKQKITKLAKHSLDMTDNWVYAIPLFVAIFVLDALSDIIPNTAALVIIAFVYCLFKSSSRLVNLWVSTITWAYIALTFSKPDLPFRYAAGENIRVLLWGISLFSIAVIMTYLREQFARQTSNLEFTLSRYRMMTADLSYEQSLMQNLMDNTPDWIYFKDTKSRFIRSNKAHNDAMGLKENENLFGKTDFDFYPTQKAENYLAEETELLATGKPVLKRLALGIDHNGQRQWTSSTKVPVFNTDRQIVGLVGITRDITEQKEFEENLIASTEWYRLLANNIPNISVIMYDMNLNFLIAEGELLARHGYFPEKLIGKSLREVFQGEQLTSLMSAYLKALSGEKVTYENSSGDYKYTSTMLPVRNTADKIVAGLIVIRDTTNGNTLA